MVYKAGLGSTGSCHITPRDLDSLLFWAVVVGKRQGQVLSSGVSGLPPGALCEEGHISRWPRDVEKVASPSFDVNNDPWPKSTYLQADLGCV